MNRELKNPSDWLGIEPPEFAKTDKGKKHDEGKAMFDLVPLEELEGLARVFEFGAKKYGFLNWREFEPTEENFRRFRSALLRHFLQVQKDPNKADEESGLLHVHHVIWNALMIAYLQHKNTAK